MGNKDTKKITKTCQIKYSNFTDVMPKKEWKCFKKKERQSAKKEIRKELRNKKD